MPQMSPLSWEILFVYFMSIYLIINMMIYWQYNNKIKTLKSKINYNNYNWKW